MNNPPDVYYLESIEQLRVLADDLRQQIIGLIEAEPLTVTQIGAALAVAPAKIHYHVRELERVALVRLVETREKGGILEKYYRAVARSFLVSNDLLQRVGPDTLVAAGNELVQSLAQSFVDAFARAARRQTQRGAGTDQRQGGDASPSDELSAHRSHALTSSHLWLTGDEFTEITWQVHELLRPYESRRGLPGERQYTAVQMLYETVPLTDAAEDQAAPTPSPSIAATPTPPRRSRSVAIGVFSYSRAELERVIQEGKALDLIILGVCTFDASVSADLVDRAIARFRHRGALHATAAVREVLRRKAQAAIS